MARKKPPTFTELKARQRRLREGFEPRLALRAHRAISWIRAAERASADGDKDGAFISYWIAFNAAYAQRTELARQSAELQIFRRYFRQLVRLGEGGLFNAIWQEFSGPIRTLLDNHFVFEPYWRWQNGDAECKDWRGRFDRQRSQVNRALAKGDTAIVIEKLFDRLYVLRNQLIHGGATWSGELNRSQVQDGAAILASLVPRFVDLMMSHPDEDWGDPPYPVSAAAPGR